MRVRTIPFPLVALLVMAMSLTGCRKPVAKDSGSAALWFEDRLISAKEAGAVAAGAL